MPNVTGLDTAPDLLSRYTPAGITDLPYGRSCVVTVSGGSATLATVSGTTLAVFNGTTARAALNRIDSDTVHAVNAFLKPLGKVKHYWRAKPGEVPYRWHPTDPSLAPTSVVAPRPKRVAAPKPAPVAAPVKAEAAPVAPVATPVAPVVPTTVHPATMPVIETVRVWSDQYAKRPIAKPVTKTYSLVGDVLIPTVDLDILDAMLRQRNAGDPCHVLITGPRGTAKTKVATQWAFVNDLPVVIVAGQSIQTADDWFGGVKPSTTGAGFEWVWSDAARLILSGQPCLIILDELNRPENERALNGIMDLLDWRATAKPLNAPHAVRLSPGQCVIATLNEGVEYVGTVEIDAAVRDRFSIGGGIRMAYTSEAIETRIIRQQVPGIDATPHGADVAKRLARIGAIQRAKVNGTDGDIAYPSGTTLSTRALVGIASKVVRGGLSPKAAIWAVARATFQPEDEKALGALIESQFGADAAPLVDDTLADDDDIERMLDAEGA